MSSISKSQSFDCDERPVTEQPIESPVRSSRAKSVRFSPKCRARLYQPSPTNKTWYNEDEYSQFQEDSSRIVLQLLSKDLGEPSASPSARTTHQSLDKQSGERSPLPVLSMGLEHRLNPSMAALRRERRANAFDAVWFEQVRQFESDDFCEETLAKAYKSFAAAAQEEARERAMIYLNDDEHFEKFDSSNRTKLSHEAPSTPLRNGYVAMSA